MRSPVVGRQLSISTSEAMKTLQLCAGAYASAVAGKEVSLPLDAI